jgi:hypothetical protein
MDRYGAFAAFAFASILILCPCNAAQAETCDSLLIQPTQMDYGWKGPAHDRPWPDDASFRLAITKRCGGTGAVCTNDGECGPESCQPTCSGAPGADEICEYTSAALSKRCITDMSRVCTSDAGCAGVPCVTFLGVPVPVVSSGVPFCVAAYLVDDATGTVDMADGDASLELTTRWRIHLGINLATPCPRCSASGVEQPGAAGVCDGGPANGNACTVDAVSADFGALSYDCPPANNANISGPGLYRAFGRADTGSHSATATLPCASPFDQFHPGTGGNPICLDDFTACASNDDCATAPCGLYCHCGFCDEGFGLDPDRPCMSDADCDGGTCGVAPADGELSQAQPNKCDSLVCGEVRPEQCCTSDDPGCSMPTAPIGVCNGEAAGCVTNDECLASGRGNECVLSPRKCFESTIDHSGAATASTNRCTGQTPAVACETNADCEAGACEGVCPAARFQLLTCASGASSAAYNSAVGLPGPLRLDVLASFVSAQGGVCGDGVRQFGEDCDDGNAEPYDGCGVDCSLQPRCGDVDGSDDLTATDALITLQLAIGLAPSFKCACDVLACADYNGDRMLTASDALTLLILSTGGEHDPNCPPCA